MKTIKTYGELKEYLLAVMDYVDDNKMCKKNNKVSKEKLWNWGISACIENADDKRCSELIVKNIITEFPEYLRCDYAE